MKLIIFCGIYLFINSPLLSQKVVKLETEKSITFNNNGTFNQYSYFLDQKTKEESILLVDYKNSFAYFYNIKGKKKDSTSLKELKLLESRSPFIAQVSQGRLLAYKATGKAYLINNTGEIITTYNIDSLLSSQFPHQKNKYFNPKVHEYNGVIKIYFQISWLTSDNVTQEKKQELLDNDIYSYLEVEKQEQIKTPFLMEISLTEKPSVLKVFQTFNASFVNPNEYVPSIYPHHYNFYKNKLIVCTDFSNKVWCYDLINNKVEEITIQSDHFSLNTKLIDLNNPIDSITVQYVFRDYMKELIYENSRILSCVYNEKKEQYIVYLKHHFEKTGNKKLEIDASYEKKSLLFYDRNGEQLNEFVLEDGVYTKAIFNTSTNLLLGTTNRSKPGYDPKKFTFDVFKIN